MIIKLLDLLVKAIVILQLLELLFIVVFYMTDPEVATCRHNYGRYSIWNKECILPTPQTIILFQDDHNSN